MLIILFLLLTNINNAPTKGEEFIIYHEATPVGNDVTNFTVPYEDWKYSKAMHFACGNIKIIFFI